MARREQTYSLLTITLTVLGDRQMISFKLRINSTARSHFPLAPTAASRAGHPAA
jgi:hypothetical protein